MATSDALQFYLLGPFEVYRAGQRIRAQEWHSQQTRAVGKILLARRGQVVATGQLIEMLWPGEDPQAGRSRLHVRISQLRKTLGGGASLVQTVDGGYLFSPDERCWLDIDAFEAAVADGVQQQEQGQQREAIEAYEQARALYRGDFLSEDLYADWTFPQRETYRERFLNLLTELAECYAQQGRYRLAVARLQEALARDPLRESIYVRLMLYHYYAGERAQALRVYERCRTLLADELQVEPLQATIELGAQIRSGRLWANAQAPRYPPPIYEGRLFAVPYSLNETPLVGREREYAWLVEQWQSERVRVVLLCGEAGVGKSRLAAAFSGYVQAQGWQVLPARLPSGQQAPFAPLVAALQPLLQPAHLERLSPAAQAALAILFPEIAQLVEELPPLPPLSPEGERQRLYRALAELAAASSLERTLLLVDDAQRLSAAGFEMLIRLAGPLKMLLSYRSEEALPGHPLQDIFRTAIRPEWLAELQLKPLAAGSVGQLINELAAGEWPELATQIFAQTNGNPLYVVALLQHLFEAGQLYVDAGGGWGRTADLEFSLPPTVQAAIEARLQHLNRAQRRVFDLAAVLGGEFDFALLQQASQQPEEALLTVLDELIDLGLVREPRSQGRREFTIAHDRYTEVAYATLPAVRRRQIHRQAGEALERLHAGDLQAHYAALADHFGQAGVVARERRYAVLAGEQAAARFARAEALRYLSRALELTGQAAGRARLLLVREQVYDLQGDRARQQEDLAALAELAQELETDLQAEIAVRRAAYAWIIGEDAQAMEALSAAISLARAGQAAEIEAAALLLRGRAQTDQTRARQDLQQALSLANRQGLRAMAGDILRALGNACFWGNDYAASERHYEQALAIHRAVGDLRGELATLNNLAFLYQLWGRLPAARLNYEQGLSICQQIGDRLALGVLLSNLGELALQLGDFRAALDWLQQALEIRAQIENEEGVAVVRKRLGDLFCQQGRFDPAREHYQHALAISRRIAHPGLQGEALTGLGRLECELGDYAQAQACFEQAEQVLQDPQAPARLRLLVSWSLLQHLQGEDQAALEAGQQALAHSEQMPTTQAAALTRTAQALCGLGRREAAREAFDRALEIRTRLGQPHLAAEALAGLAELALGEDDLEQAQAQIEPVLGELLAGSLAGPVQVGRLYLSGYRVLAAGGDERAGALIAAAHTLQQQRGQGIQDAAGRRRYMQAVACNREILQLYHNQQ